MGSPATPGEAARRRSRRAVLAVCIAMAVVGVNTTAIGVATRGIADELDVSLSELEWIMGAFLVTAAAFALAGGRMGDVIGRTRTFMIGCGIFAGGCLLAALAPGTVLLVTGRAIQGVGAALVMPSSIEVAAAFPSADGPRNGFRLRGIVYASAFGIGPLIGGVLTDNVSWRAVFWVELLVLLIAVGIAVPLQRATSQLPKPPTRDFLGAGLAASIVFLVVLLASRGRSWGWAPWPTLAVTALVLVLAVWFTRLEARTPHPLLHPSLLRDRTVIGANVATLGASIGMLGLIYFFNVFAQSALVFDSTAVAVAFALVPFTLSIVVFSMISRILAKHIGASGPVIVGLGLSVVGFGLLSTVTAGTTEADLVLPLVLCGIGSGIANAGLTAPAVMTEIRRVDEAAGLISMTRYIGAAVAIAIGTASYLAVAVANPAPELAVGGVDAEDAALGGSGYQQAIATLESDLRRPFEAAALESTAQAFAATMRLAAIVLALLTVVSAWLLGRRPDVSLEGTGPSTR